MDYLYRRVCRAVRTKKVKIRLRRMKYNGEQLGQQITLSPRHDLLPTAIHETLHYLYPDWSETKVLEAERRLCVRLSARQFKFLLRVLSEVL